MLRTEGLWKPLDWLAPRRWTTVQPSREWTAPAPGPLTRGLAAPACREAACREVRLPRLPRAWTSVFYRTSIFLYTQLSKTHKNIHYGPPISKGACILGHGRLLRPPPSRSLCPHRCPCSWPGRGPGAGLCAEGGAPAWPRTRPACPPVWAGLLASASLNTHLIVRGLCSMTLARENPGVCVPALGDAGTCQT